MKQIKIFYKNKPVIQFETELDDFQAIIEMLYTKYKGAIGFEINTIDNVKKKIRFRNV